MNGQIITRLLPSNGNVASIVTVVVSTWFLVAAGAILSDPASPYTQRPTPAFHETITVTAQAEPAPAIRPARETITVVARRGDSRRGVSL